MSSGFFGFFAHLGCLAALEESGFAPARISGSSAGALAGALWASGCSVSSLEAALFNLKKSDFWDPGPGFGLLRGIRFRGIVQQICPVGRIEECRVPLAISVFDPFKLATRSLRRGWISDAVYASCCVPFLFQPIRIGKSLYLDGGIGDRAGLRGIPKNSRTLYLHLASKGPDFYEKWTLNRILQGRPRAVAIRIHNVVTVGPGKMERGRLAFEQTRAAFMRALGQPIIHGQVWIRVAT
ncbi:MAG: patatin-like phospholipase family protein [Gammaproteobacteria bacterium]